jgi:hypothetical protein
MRPRQTLSLVLFCGLVLAGLAGLFVLLAFYTRKGAYGSDWQTFYDAATRWRDNGRVYTVADGFFNPPPTLVLLRLFIFLPYLPSRILWGALSACMLLASGWLTTRALAWRPDGRALALGAWWILVSAPCVLLAPLTGNWSGLILLSFSLSVRLFQKGHEGWAGAVLAVTLVKPQLAFLTLPLLLYKRRWRAVGGYLGACAISVLVSFPLVGRHAYGDYFQVQRSVADWTVTNNALQIDVPGLHGLFLQQWPGSVAASSAANLLSLGLVALLAWFWRGPWQPASSRFVIGWSLVLVVTMLGSSFAHSYDLVLLIPPCVTLFVAGERARLAWPEGWFWARAAMIALYVSPYLVLLFRQHFVVPAMLAALAVLWWSAPPVSAAYEPEWGSITKTIAAPNRRRL